MKKMMSLLGRIAAQYWFHALALSAASINQMRILGIAATMLEHACLARLRLPLTNTSIIGFCPLAVRAHAIVRNKVSQDSRAAKTATDHVGFVRSSTRQ